jgi:xylulose-5-phosphate/fructose-6-phosphate phosphoketolase
MTTRTLEPEVLHKMDAYWRAANYLSVGQSICVTAFLN